MKIWKYMFSWVITVTPLVLRTQSVSAVFYPAFIATCKC